MSEQVRVAIFGAAGRMGTQLLNEAPGFAGAAISAALVAPTSPLLGTPLGPDALTATCDLDTLSAADVVIDFSTPAACATLATECARRGLALVSGTTGLDSAQLRTLDAAAETIPLLHAANFSVGVNLLEHLLELAARGFGADADIEIFEAHHRRKVDAPSGTALLLGRAAARGRDWQLEDVATWARQGQVGPRPDDEIGFQVLRGADIVGEHTAYLCAAGERLELTHRATDRAIFARGALRAALWLASRPAGRYHMRDLLFGPH
ncbi:4-hydroxy-tetrahydrodipicolinate reductase [Lujinxingia litoralis]|uniref:4-hydroxy-tetrahydrodipicolinate reductase n=1 Tax=Lujinxingia litoralis TaxID=2211119 RepID=A0A328C6T0_9DELT|nr:4-hydroxy-tetrahydrodipicolinate reductase [Lujinxingia litoralis]RAL22966.1 4-hydroxy-tetrahydrodipicolinate reductase [Lujinxingia litoralis]